MREKEIVIFHPQENTDPLRSFSLTHSGLSSRRFNEFCVAQRITPATHPTACDLFAGQGEMSLILKDHGWDSRNITCIDLCHPNSDGPLVTGAQWLFWDLRELTKAIMRQESLPKAVLENRGKFDLVVMAYNTRLPSDWEHFLTDFFAKDNKDSLIVPSQWDWEHLGR